MDRRVFVTMGGMIALVTVSGGMSYGVVNAEETTGTLPQAKLTDHRTDAVDCVLSPESMEGPYFIDGLKIRSDLREDRDGAELDVELIVSETQSCRAIQGALVEIWSCDAQGYYSGHLDKDPNIEAESPEHVPPTDDSTFLRGGQLSDELGRVRFKTIFPGWYAGRTVHIHVMVSTNGRTLFTGQLYFDEALTQQLIEGPAYQRGADGAPRLTNATDFIFQEARGDSTTLKTTEASPGQITAHGILGVSLD